MKKLLLLFMVLVSILSACNKNVVYYPIDTSLKAAFNFTPGSYWIYRDSISGEMDSFFVTKNQFNTTDSKTARKQGYKLDEIFINISQCEIFPTLNTTQTASWQLEYVGSDIDLDYYYPNNEEARNPLTFNPLFDYPFSDSFKTSFSNTDLIYWDTGVIININGLLTLNGQNFNSVAEVSHHGSFTENGYARTLYSYDDWFYICPNIGLIKIIQNHPQDSIYRVWELERWKIVN